MTVTVSGTLTYSTAPTTINNATNATLTITGGTLDGASLYRLLNITDGNVTLNNMALQNGRFPGGNGGAITNSDTLTIIGSTLNNNLAINGGAISNSGILTLNSSVLNNNTATTGGGAIVNSGSFSTVSTLFQNNSATVYGGAIQNSGNGIGIYRATFLDNGTSTALGGAIYT
jgi:predicted outer membrane repeat protein